MISKCLGHKSPGCSLSLFVLNVNFCPLTSVGVAKGSVSGVVAGFFHRWKAGAVLLRLRHRLVAKVQHKNLLTQGHRLGVTRVVVQQGWRQRTLAATPRLEVLAVVGALRLKWRN